MDQPANMGLVFSSTACVPEFGKICLILSSLKEIRKHILSFCYNLEQILDDSAPLSPVFMLGKVPGNQEFSFLDGPRCSQHLRYLVSHYSCGQYPSQSCQE